MRAAAPDRPENSGLSLRTPVLTFIHPEIAIFGRARRTRDGGDEVRRTQDTEALTQPGHPDRWFTLRARTAHTAAAGRSRRSEPSGADVRPVLIAAQILLLGSSHTARASPFNSADSILLPHASGEPTDDPRRRQSSTSSPRMSCASRSSPACGKAAGRCRD